VNGKNDELLNNEEFRSVFDNPSFNRPNMVGGILIKGSTARYTDIRCKPVLY